MNIDKKYDKFFGEGYWEETYKKHIVAFTEKCISEISKTEGQADVVVKTKIAETINDADSFLSAFAYNHLVKNDETQEEAKQISRALREITDEYTEFEEVLYNLVESNYLLGKAEYNRNPKYNDEHFQHKAEKGIMDYLQKYNNRLFKEFITKLT